MAKARQNLGTTIYEDILDRIRRSEFGPDDRLIDASIAAELGVSRMPVRDALNRLTHEGYLAGTTRGYVLARISAQEATEIFEMRKLLEPRAIASAVAHLDDAAIGRMGGHCVIAQRALDRMDQLEFVTATRNFYMEWLAVVPNKVLADTIHRFADQTSIIRFRTFLDRESSPILLAGFHRILDAIRKNDPLGAHDAQLLLIQQGLDRFSALLDPGAPGSCG